MRCKFTPEQDAILLTGHNVEGFTGRQCAYRRRDLKRKLAPGRKIRIMPNTWRPEEDDMVIAGIRPIPGRTERAIRHRVTHLIAAGRMQRSYGRKFTIIQLVECAKAGLCKAETARRLKTDHKTVLRHAKRLNLIFAPYVPKPAATSRPMLSSVGRDAVLDQALAATKDLRASREDVVTELVLMMLGGECKTAADGLREARRRAARMEETSWAISLDTGGADGDGYHERISA